MPWPEDTERDLVVFMPPSHLSKSRTHGVTLPFIVHSYEPSNLSLSYRTNAEHPVFGSVRKFFCQAGPQQWVDCLCFAPNGNMCKGSYGPLC